MRYSETDTQTDRCLDRFRAPDICTNSSVVTCYSEHSYSLLSAKLGSGYLH